MIQANELRIGNWVMIDGVVQKVDRISQDPLLESNGIELFYINRYRVDECSPILLTPEILEKAGFEGNDGEYTHPDNTDFDLMITCSENGLWCAYNYGNIQHNSPFPETTMGYTVNPICNPFKYLHQLQNLYFALTGQELPINNLNTTTK